VCAAVWSGRSRAGRGRASIAAAAAGHAKHPHPTHTCPHPQPPLPPPQGLVYYLPPRAFKSLLSAISETAVVGSRLYFDFINLSTMSGEGAGRGFEGGRVPQTGACRRRAGAALRPPPFRPCPPPPHPPPPKGEVFYPGFETLMVSVWNKGEYFLSGVDERKEVQSSRPPGRGRAEGQGAGEEASGPRRPQQG
jgi:hypothetical protein